MGVFDWQVASAAPCDERFKLCDVVLQLLLMGGVGAKGCCWAVNANNLAQDPRNDGGNDPMGRAEFVRKIGNKGWNESIEISRRRKSRRNSASDDAITKKGWVAVFKAIDTDGDGSISRKEWEAMFGDRSFDAWAKGNGSIGESEWLKIFTARQKPGSLPPTQNHEQWSGAWGLS